MPKLNNTTSSKNKESIILTKRSVSSSRTVRNCPIMSPFTPRKPPKSYSSPIFNRSISDSSQNVFNNSSYGILPRSKSSPYTKSPKGKQYTETSKSQTYQRNFGNTKRILKLNQINNITKDFYLDVCEETDGFYRDKGLSDRKRYHRNEVYKNSFLDDDCNGNLPNSISSFTDLKLINRSSSAFIFTGRFNKRKFAIKAFADPLSSRERVERFLREQTLICSLKSPFVLKQHCVFLERGFPRLVTDFCPLGTLKDLLKVNGKFLKGAGLVLCRQLATSVHYIHNKGIVHGDVCTENVFLSARMNLKLGDFGLALVDTNFKKSKKGFVFSNLKKCNSLSNSYNSGKNKDPNLITKSFTSNSNIHLELVNKKLVNKRRSKSLTNLVNSQLNKLNKKLVKETSNSKNGPEEILFSGHTTYLSPELFNNINSVPSYASDIFSLGLIFLEILGGIKLPKSGKAFKQLRENFEVPFSFVSDGKLNSLINEMLSKDPNLRPNIKTIKGQINEIYLKYLESVKKTNSLEKAFKIKKPEKLTEKELSKNFSWLKDFRDKEDCNEFGEEEEFEENKLEPVNLLDLLED